MSSISERGVPQPERFTRREALSRITGLAAAALGLTGCVEIELPPGTQYGGRPQVVSEPQIDEEAARNVSALYIAAIGAALFFLRGIK